MENYISTKKIFLIKVGVILYIELKNVTKVIKKHEVLKDISIHMESGKIYGFQGENGSGKTMLMRAICGLINVSTGSVDINGEILGEDIDFPKSLGVLIEHPGFIPSYTAFKNLKYLAEIKKIITNEDIRATLQLVGLNPDDNKKVRAYSLGMKQKLGIAAAIMENPELIILDEPFNGLDEASVVNLNQILADLKTDNRLIVISCHDRDKLNSLSDEIYRIDNGQVIEHIIAENRNE